ncbi:beta-ketoacyl-[acyl-carrier-protein] synthase family protein [Kitasatospora fiedleri]|uniref:hypothetical protein n=1 Tax=Kitasatospora fiedleri TaxID=2991545 RepID=UPI002499C642|nr:hypothetical protein [Kitasatospora fiedleri]
MLAGRADADEVRRDGYRRLPVDDRRAAPDLAVEAGRTALERAGLTADRLGLVAHAWIHHQGHDFWSPAHYVASSLGARNAEPVGVQQMCNGGAAALRIALDRMAADPGVEAALVTTADSFPAPGFERWRADYGVAYGDGGTALLLTREHARYRVAGLVTVAAPELELMHRGTTTSPRPRGSTVRRSTCGAPRRRSWSGRERRCSQRRSTARCAVR